MAKAPITIRLDEKTKALFKLMHFEEIPEEAKYVAFFEDGYAQLVDEITFTGFVFPDMVVVSYYKDVEFLDYE